MNSQVRRATLQDAPAIAEIHVRTWQHVYRGQVPDDYLDAMSIENRTKGWEKQLSDPVEGVYTLVIETDSKVVGWAVVGKNRDDDVDQKKVAELHAIYLNHEYIGQGYGTKLILEALELLRQAGYSGVTLWVLKTNELGRKFYQAKGWHPDGHTKTDSSRGFPLHEIRYRIDLYKPS